MSGVDVVFPGSYLQPATEFACYLRVSLASVFSICVLFVMYSLFQHHLGTTIEKWASCFKYRSFLVLMIDCIIVGRLFSCSIHAGVIRWTCSSTKGCFCSSINTCVNISSCGILLTYFHAPFVKVHSPFFWCLNLLSAIVMWGKYYAFVSILCVVMYGIVELAGHMLVALVSGSHQRHPLLIFSYFLP